MWIRKAIKGYTLGQSGYMAIVNVDCAKKYKRYFMIKVLWLSVLLLTAQNAFGDSGTSHIIRAKIIFQGKEHVGYFKVWGYLYLTSDSLKYDVPKFTRQAK